MADAGASAGADPPRADPARAEPSWVGDLLELEVGDAAHGGSCVARHAGRVVFVRHALPGERVQALVTEDRGGAFCYADAVEIRTPSPARVEPPCPHAGPARCGGCDWQHADSAEQRRIKTAVVREQFRRVAHLEPAGHDELTAPFAGVEALPGGLLGWRSRITFARAADGTLGLHRHRSHDVEPVATCPLGTIAVRDVPTVSGSRTVPHDTIGLEHAAGADDGVALLAHRPGRGRRTRGRRPPDRVELLSGPGQLRHRVLGREFTVRAGGFWQAHPAAPETLATVLLEALDPQPGESVLELYAGAGMLTASLAGAVGPTGRVLGFESDPGAVSDANRNLADLPQAEVRQARVGPDPARWLPAGTAPMLVVLDPPRAGAGTALIRALTALSPRAIGYVSCDPATLARDVAAAREQGWRLTALRAFDAFPMTHHIECVARLERP